MAQIKRLKPIVFQFHFEQRFLKKIFIIIFYQLSFFNEKYLFHEKRICFHSFLPSYVRRGFFQFLASLIAKMKFFFLFWNIRMSRLLLVLVCCIVGYARSIDVKVDDENPIKVKKKKKSFEINMLIIIFVNDNWNWNANVEN